MEGKLQTSFIPKKPIVETRAHKAPTTNIFSIIVWFIFILVVAASVGVYLYEIYLNNNINAKNAELVNILNRFDTASVQHFVALDARLHTANTLLNSHLAFSALLGLISDNTVKSVQFTNLKYSYDDSSKTTVSLTGVAPSFSSVALQSDKFSSLSYFTDQSFSNVSLTANGTVTFNFSASVSPSVLKYSSLLQNTTNTADVVDTTNTLNATDTGTSTGTSTLNKTP